MLIRSRCLTSIEAEIPELPDLNSPELALIKSRLARAYLGHKANIGAAHATDQDILDHVDDVTALMLGALARAMAERRHTWLQHYGCVHLSGDRAARRRAGQAARRLKS
jgi:hypothetical protein